MRPLSKGKADIFMTLFLLQSNRTETCRSRMYLSWIGFPFLWTREANILKIRIQIFIAPNRRCPFESGFFYPVASLIHNSPQAIAGRVKWITWFYFNRLGTYLMTSVFPASQLHSNFWVTFTLHLHLKFGKKTKIFLFWFLVYLNHKISFFSCVSALDLLLFQFVKVTLSLVMFRD